jgi:hypothetical protein
VIDQGLKVITTNKVFFQTFDVRPDETEGVLIYELTGSPRRINRFHTVAHREPLNCVRQDGRRLDPEQFTNV